MTNDEREVTGARHRAESEAREVDARATWPRAWGWLFPATYALHILEEWRCGETFTVWIARLTGVESALGEFLLWNSVALLLMSASIALTIRFKSLGWLLLAYGTAFLLNTLSHLSASFYTNSYSPGLVSSLLLWLPLGALTLLRFRKTLSRRSRRAGLLVGLLIHCIVLSLTLLV
ncbi:MAG TPA: HXXEE domain-containing protein [Pyrinomonadaceae bacterium]|nr:HXXEE domain-containing protein [Pyrinomonadaceae bacterium]